MKRSWKKLLLKAFNPFDYAARILNHKTHLSPLHLRRDIADPRVPKAIVAFDEARLFERFNAHRLEVLRPAQYRSWAGDTTGLSHQDIVILRKQR